MSVDVELHNTLAILATDLQKPMEAAAMGIAAAIQDRLAPYPRARPRIAGKGYYIRGRGSFSPRGKLQKASETLNRKWSIKRVAWGARLRNTASYAVYVHGAKKQNHYHGKHGWVREDEAIAQSRGDATAIMSAAISAAFKEAGK